MKAPITSGTVSWPAVSDVPPIIIGEGHDGMERTLMPLPDDAGIGWGELIPLAVGMNIARGGASFKEKVRGWLIPYNHLKGALVEPVFVISAVQTGRVILREYDLKTDFQCGKGYVVFRHLKRIDYEIILDASSDIDGINLFIGDSALEMLLGVVMANELLEKLRIIQSPSATVQFVPPHITAVLFSAVGEHLTGQMRRLHAQSKALEFICALTGHLLAGDGKEPSGSPKKEKMIQQLHDDLMFIEGKVPTLDELARQYGMSARVLNEEFRKVYGVSIFSYISELRLKEAHEALLQTDIPMKNMALNMGYSHVNHFISAFGKKFGYSPGSLRRRK